MTLSVLLSVGLCSGTCWHNCGPLVLSLPIHNVGEPLLDYGRDRPSYSAFAHRHFNIFPLIMDPGNSRNEILSVLVHKCQAAEIEVLLTAVPAANDSRRRPSAAASMISAIVKLRSVTTTS